MSYSAICGRLAAAGLLCLSAGCNRAATNASDGLAASAPLADPLEVTAGATAMEHVKIGEPKWAQVGATFTVAARVEADEARTTRVGSPVIGRITSLAIREGQDVQRGQLLMSLTSIGLSDAQLGFLKGISQKQVAQRAVDRAQLLLKADVIGSAELQRREAELYQAQAEHDAARDQLLLLGMPPDAIDEVQKTRHINSALRVFATMDGTVLSRKVMQGQVVQPADVVCEIADLSSLWLVADVPEQNAGNLKRGPGGRVSDCRPAGKAHPWKIVVRQRHGRPGDQNGERTDPAPQPQPQV